MTLALIPPRAGLIPGTRYCTTCGLRVGSNIKSLNRHYLSAQHRAAQATWQAKEDALPRRRP